MDMKLYEVTFSIEGGDSNLQWVTTQISAFDDFKARAMVQAQYGSKCYIHSCYLCG
jgi:hypothetical protein